MQTRPLTTASLRGNSIRRRQCFVYGVASDDDIFRLAAALAVGEQRVGCLN